MTFLIKVPDMTCGHCVQSITKALQAVNPAADVQVDLIEHTVQVSGFTDEKRAVQAISDAGFSPEKA